MAHFRVQITGVSVGLYACPSQEETSSLWCVLCEGHCCASVLYPTPTSQSNCKTKHWERVGQNQNSPSAGDGYRAALKSSPNGNCCCSSCLLGHHRHKENSRELGRLSVPALSCALFPTTPEHSLAATVLPWGIAGAVWFSWQMPRRITSCREYEFYGLAALYCRSVN